MSDKNIGQKLKEIRLSRSLKQCDVAEGINMSRTAISNIESGRRSLTLNTLKKFADFYKIDVTTITEEFNNPKDEVIDILERTRKIFENNKVPKEDKEDLYLSLMTIYLKSKKH